MPQSLSIPLTHLVFSTKDRMPFLKQPFRAEMHAYLATTARNHDCPCLRVGGVDDHIHMIVDLSRTLAVAKLIEELKTESSKWAKTQGPSLRKFSWQRWYGAFSFSYDGLDRLVKYVDNQEHHHKKMDFKTEYRKILDKYRIEYDERYVWD